MNTVASDRTTKWKKSANWLALSLSIVAMTVASVASAKTPLPQADNPGSTDDPLLGRYAGSVILVYERRSLGDLVLPTGKLLVTSSSVHLLSQRTVEGQRTHFLYYVGKGVSPLEVVRNYQTEAKSQGGSVLFECKEDACGGNATSNTWNGASVGMLNFLYPQSAARAYDSSGPEYCAMNAGVEGLQHTTIDLGGGRGFATVTAYIAKWDSSFACGNFRDATFVAVDLVDTTPRKSRMVGVKSAEIASALQASGRIALYGIYFDVDKAELKPESDATLKEIAKLMEGNPVLKLLVVGHTDNAGTLAFNMELSQRRAASVVAALTGEYGIKPDRLTPLGVSYAAPVAPNKTEEGRAKNRRVELVEQ